MSWSQALAEVGNPNGEAFVEAHFSQKTREMGHPARVDDLRADSSGILPIEWGEKFPWFVRERDVETSLERGGESARKILISS